MPREKGPKTSRATIDKGALLEAVRDDVERALATMLDAAKTAREAATHAEMKPENDKDTRSVEMGYLAGAQAERARELAATRDLVASLAPRAFAPDERIAALALVTVVDLASEETSTLFIVPVPGGKKVTVGKATITLVSPASPLGDALVGKKVGDIVEVALGPRTKELEVVSVS